MVGVGDWVDVGELVIVGEGGCWVGNLVDETDWVGVESGIGDPADWIVGG